MLLASSWQYALLEQVFEIFCVTGRMDNVYWWTAGGTFSMQLSMIYSQSIVYLLCTYTQIYQEGCLKQPAYGRTGLQNRFWWSLQASRIFALLKDCRSTASACILMEAHCSWPSWDLSSIRRFCIDCCGSLTRHIICPAANTDLRS